MFFRFFIKSWLINNTTLELLVQMLWHQLVLSIRDKLKTSTFLYYENQFCWKLSNTHSVTSRPSISTSDLIEYLIVRNKMWIFRSYSILVVWVVDPSWKQIARSKSMQITFCFIIEYKIWMVILSYSINRMQM